MSQPAAITPGRRQIMVGSTVLASTMFAVDTTIANVALPQMQSAMGASQEQIIWVITSYMIASAIATPLSAWLASRYGRRPVLLASVAGFTAASMFCGMASGLTGAVLARTIQGATGAAMMPLGQSAVIDITPREQFGRTMSIIGLGVMFGPLIGPTLGGWLTENFSWRWVYFINLPIGLAALVGLFVALPDSKDASPPRFDMFGFVALSIFLASFQLMLDRGQHLDWFDSAEIWAYALLIGLFGYLMLVHMFTASDTYVRPRIFADRNFALGCLLSGSVGVLTFSTIPIATSMMQQNLGYTPLHTGLVSSPRSIGTLIAMLGGMRFVGKLDDRLFLLGGLGLNAVGLYMLSQLSLLADERQLLVAGLFQGFGSGLMYPPLSTLVFATLPPALRNEGASLFALTRSMGSSLGISFLQTGNAWNTAAVQSRLTEGLRPDNPAVHWAMPDLDLASAAQAAGLARRAFAEASMVAKVDAFWLTFVIAIAILPVVALLRPPKRTATPVQISVE